MAFDEEELLIMIKIAEQRPARPSNAATPVGAHPKSTARRRTAAAAAAAAARTIEQPFVVPYAVAKHDWTLDWYFHPPFSIAKPGATIFVGTVSIVHSLCHIPHLLMYRRLGMFTAFWSIVGLGLILGAILEDEWLYDIWIWYSCVYVPVMLVTMYVVLTGAVWALHLQPLRAVFATVAIIFYLFMFYCIVYVMSEKRKIFTTTTTSVRTTTTCSWCPTCTTQKCTTPPPKTTKASVHRSGLRLIQYLGDRV
ncbi:uncharacterized protein LOC125231934 [Leguminivora glycinivorella]|uniref:uncharacterized protein LOC125231934 n=1 Tax=Leguminivora glycinivorella TaxID=1035111 RepID=UPI00200EF128|nr:uncharacterized protein LOC125231934 [Leguminivora glycinivorella]